MTTQNFDIILAGAGLSGLTLATELARRPAFQDKKILLLDRDAKTANDRTWCFWATDAEPLPPVVFKTWDTCRFFSPGFESDMNISPYRYRMVRGIDFYQWAKNELAEKPNIRQVQTAIRSIDAAAGTVTTEAGVFSAPLVFNSAFTKTRVVPEAGGAYTKPPFSAERDKGKPKSVFLLQHFKGWLIETEQATFDPSKMTFMDFRIPQAGETRFVYVLPFSETRALVEFTVFSPALLPAEAYDAALTDYIRNYLKIDRFHIEEDEFGVIPMTDFPFPARSEGRVIHIGTAGGFVKASSGYAFKRTWRKTRAFVDDWEKTVQPDPAVFRSTYPFRLFDSIFLRVLANDNALGSAIFTSLFKKLPPALVLRFLDEDSTFVENVRLLQAPPPLPFQRALFQQVPKLHQI